MAFRIEDKLVIGVASSALFELDEADAVFREKGLAAYRAYQLEHQHDIFRKGVAFPFIKRLLAMNKYYPDSQPVEVVLLSHNDPDTGQRVFNSIQHYNLNITRAAFTTGDSPFKYIPAYNVSLFLSANAADVRQANIEGYAAGQVLASRATNDISKQQSSQPAPRPHRNASSPRSAHGTSRLTRPSSSAAWTRDAFSQF